MLVAAADNCLIQFANPNIFFTKITIEHSKSDYMQNKMLLLHLQLDLQDLKIHHVCDFLNEGSGGIYRQGCMLHFSMPDNRDNAEVTIECHNFKESRSHIIGTLHNALLMRHFVTVPCFPQFTPSSNHKAL